MQFESLSPSDTEQHKEKGCVFQKALWQELEESDEMVLQVAFPDRIRGLR